MRSAIIGDSPIMLILANHLKRKEKVIIYTDKKKIGGAWSYIKFKKNFISRQTNVIVPANKKVEKYQLKINNALKKYNITVSPAQGFHKPNVHLAKKNYKYDLTKLFNTRKKFNTIKKYINQITVDNNIKIGNNYFDKVYLPYFNGIKILKINNKNHNISPRVIKSKHILLIFRNLPQKEFIYTENFDECFDRAQITKFKDYTSFTARVRLENKKIRLSSLLKKSKINEFLYEGNLIKKDLLFYKNYFRSKEQIDELKFLCKSTNLELIDTFQFYEAFLDLNKKYLNQF